MENTKKKNYFIIVLLILFIIFISFYTASISGYYDASEYNKAVLTKESMERFEKDLKDNKDISVKNYMSQSYKSYSNNLSSVGAKTGRSVEYIMKKGISKTFKVLSKLFIE
ncbi:MAG: hypothetical protein RR228_03200 [Bacilli bacterium]